MSTQSPAAVVMIRPHHFSPNPDTESDNAFQSRDGTRSTVEHASAAYDEVTAVAASLEAVGITVHLFDDTERTRPDAVFPNNWFSTHSGGHIALYPMFSPSRRSERRFDVIEFLKRNYRVQDVIDYSGLEYDDVFLEGTGAMVLDHDSRIAYTARSNRADPIALERFCTNFGYEPMAFDAVDESGFAIYHTNVMMSIASEVAFIGLDMIADPARRVAVRRRLEATGREIIALTTDQVHDFAGNVIELRSPNGNVLALSSRALASLEPTQVEVISRSCSLLPLDVPTIELAGGSVRCMIGGVHLDPRDAG